MIGSEDAGKLYKLLRLTKAAAILAVRRYLIGPQSHVRARDRDQTRMETGWGRLTGAAPRSFATRPISKYVGRLVRYGYPTLVSVPVGDCDVDLISGSSVKSSGGTTPVPVRESSRLEMNCHEKIRHQFLRLPLKR
jgi:hypothetical protein